MDKKEKLINLKIKDVVFKCSKENLISSSDYFKAMFSSNFIESNKDILELKDVEPDAMKIILKFIEDGTSDFLENINVCLSVLKCAAMLQFCTIQKICEDSLIQNLTTSNCLEIHQETYKFGNFKTCKASSTFCFWRFEDVIETEFFLNQPMEGVISFLSCLELNLSSHGEWLIWEAILKWIHHKEDERIQLIMPILQCLNFAALTNDDLSSMIFYDVISGDSRATMFLEKIIALRKKEKIEQEETKKLSCDEKEIRDMAIKVIKNPKFRNAPKVPCVACYKKRIRNHYKGSEVFPVILYYNDTIGKVEELVQLSKLDQSYETCIGFRVCAIGPFIYITGGQYIIGGNQWNNDFWSYNSIKDKWKVHAPLPQRRRSHMVCVIDSVIYLIGGYGKHRISLSSVDAYDTKSEKWLSCQDIPFHGMGAHCTFKNRILVFVNGHLFSYYPEKKIWTSMELKSGKQKSFSIAMTHGNTVYLLGSYSKDIYKIKPDHNNIVEYFGSFTNNTENVCVDAHRLISFAEEESIEEGSKITSIIEVLYIPEDEEDEDNESVRNCSKLNNSAVVNCSTKIENESQLGRVVWREEASNTHSTFNASNFYGCFTLFKV